MEKLHLWNPVLSFIASSGLQALLEAKKVSPRRLIIKSAMQRQVASRPAKLDLWIAVKTKCLLRVLGNDLKRPIVFFLSHASIHPVVLILTSSKNKVKKQSLHLYAYFYVSVQIFAHSNEQRHPHMICRISSCENQAWQGKVRLLCSSY